MRSGYADISGGRLRNFGQTGNWWSSTALTYTSSTDARTSVLSLNAASIYLSSSSNRWNGFSLRCVGKLWYNIGMEEIQEKLVATVKYLFGVEMDPELVVAPEDKNADYASNVALRLAKVAHKSPMVIAEEIKEELGSDQEFTVEVAAPGFLNFSFKEAYFAEKATKVSEDLDNISQDEYSGKTVVAEFSDPNPFKVLHVGHLYTSVVGDAISRLLELAGAKVVRANFGGDVGLHVGKTLWAVLQHNYSFDDINIEKLARCYVEGTAAYENDAQAKATITNLNKQIYRIAEIGEAKSSQFGGEEGELARLYWRGRELSYQYFDEFYQSIGVKFDKYYPESTVVDRGLQEVKAHIGEVYEESDGAIVYRGEKVGLHTRVFINREGVPTYETKDVGLIFTKWDDYHFAESVVITGNEQSDYMKVVLASVKEYAPELVKRTRHLTHGLVKLPGNVKMSSRKGNFLKAVDVLEMVRDEVWKDLSEHTGKKPSKDENLDARAEMITLAAVKYAFLKYKMGGDIVFDPKESVAMNGNSGVYLLYATVRAKKVLQKVKDRGNESLNKKVVQEEQSEEERRFTRRLNKKIVQYQEVIRGAIREKAPYKVCAYLYELAQEFSRFYEHVQVAGNVREYELVKTVEAYEGVMEHGLGLLGIKVPEEM